MNYLLSDPKRITQFSLRRLLFLGISVLSFVITETGRHELRPLVRQHQFNDFGITESIGNLGGIVVQIFFTLAILNPDKTRAYRLAVFLCCGYILYEFLQPILPKGTFDWNDVFGTLYGFILSVLILKLLWKVFPQQSENPAP